MSPVNLREALDALAPEPTLGGDLFDRVAGGVRRRRRRAGTAVVAAVAAVMLVSPLTIHALSPSRSPVHPATSDATPARPPAPAILADAASVTVLVHTKDPGLGDPTVPDRTFGPTTITDPARVAAVVNLVNGLAVAVPGRGPVFCALDVGGWMRVDFTDAAGRAVGRLRIALSGCASIRLTAADGTTTQLIGTDNAEPLDRTILSLLGLGWKWTR